MKALGSAVGLVVLTLVVIIAVIVAVVQSVTAEPPTIVCGLDTPELAEEEGSESTQISDRLTLTGIQADNARLILGASNQQLADRDAAVAMLMRSIARSELLNLAQTNGLLALAPLAYPTVNVLDKGEAITAYLEDPPAVEDQDEQWRPEAETIADRWRNSTANPTVCTNLDGEDPNLPGGPVTDDDIVTVNGIRVHRSIAAQLRALLLAADADGIRLSGWGWRSHQRQHELRRINGCPNDGSWTHSDDENPALWRPASACRTPTARPGRSNHESGLAVDFTYLGRTIASRRSPAFIWLATNAGRYGFRNLPSEPWHWSPNGR